MPKSKRNRVVSLTHTRKKGLEWKSNLIEEIRSHVDNYARIFVFSVQNMRNAKLKNIRQKRTDCRFFFGKNKVMSRAFGSSPSDEIKENTHKVSSLLHGQRGIFFTNSTKENICKWFSEHVETDFARSGTRSTQTIALDAGPLKQFPHSLEPHLRQLGLPTTLQKGVISLLSDFELCKEGDVLNSNQTKLLKLFGYEIAEFKIVLEAMWSNDGTFEEFVQISEKVEDLMTSDDENDSS